MKIGVIGHKGKIGSLLVQYGGFPIDCDITIQHSVERAIVSGKPDIIVLSASKSSVDYCELRENEKEVIAVNLRGADTCAKVCDKNYIPMIYLSTDHIFSGKHGNYKEKDKDKHPVNFYGLSKLAGEACLSIYPTVKIIRSSVAFTLDRDNIKEYIDYMNSGDHYTYVPDFMFRSFIYGPHFAMSVIRYANMFDSMPKVLHMAGSKSVSYFTFVKSLYKIFGHNASLVLPRKEYFKEDHIAPRPKKAGLNVGLSKKLGFEQHGYENGLMDMKTEWLIRKAK